MPDVMDHLSQDADSLLLGELRYLTPAQFDEVIQQLLIELRLELRKIRNKSTYYFAETVSMEDQNRVILFISKRAESISLSDIESLANYAGKVRAPRSILMTVGKVSHEAEREGHRRGVQVVDGAEFAALIRKSGIESLILEKFAEETVVAPPLGEDVSLESQLMLGVELLQSGELKRALEHFDRAIAAEPDSEMPWRLKGEVLDQLGHHGKALESYARALEIDENNAELWYAIGVSMYALGRYDEELQCYEKALQIDPQMEKALVNRGATLLKLQRYEEAQKSYDKALKINYRVVKVHNNRGIALKHLNRLEDALDAFEAALSLDPEFADAWLNKANLLHQLGRSEEALGSLEHVVSLRPEMSQGWIMKGEIESKLRKGKDAIESFENALELDPTNSEIKKALDYEKSKIQKEHMDLHEKITSMFARVSMEVERPPPILKEEPVAGIGKEDVEVITPEEILPEAEEQPEEPEAAEEIVELEISEVIEEVVEEEEEVQIVEPETALPTAPEEELLLEEIGEPPVGVAEEVFGDAAELMLYMRRPEVALDELEKGLRLEPMSVRMTLLKGRAKHLLNKTNEALDIFRRAVELDPANNEAIYSIEYLLNIRGDYAGAEDALRSLLNGKHWIPEILAAINCDAAGKMKNVSEYIEAAVSLEPSAIVWNYKGLLDLEQGDFESAIEAFIRAYERESIFSDPSNNIGVSYFKLGVRAEASMHYELAVSSYSRNAAAWNNRGVLLYSFDRYTEALACFDEALLTDRNPLILVNRGFTLLATDALEEALKAFDGSLSIKGTAEAYNNKGIVLVRMNRIEDAINCFEAALHLSPDFDDARGNLERYQPPEERLVAEKPSVPKEVSEAPLIAISSEDVWAKLGTVSESALKKKRKSELQEICKSLKLSTSGIKKDLIERIITTYSASNL